MNVITNPDFIRIWYFLVDLFSRNSEVYTRKQHIASRINLNWKMRALKSTFTLWILTMHEGYKQWIVVMWLTLSRLSSIRSDSETRTFYLERKHETMLLREVLVEEPHKYWPDSKERGISWTKIAEHYNKTLNTETFY